MNTTTTELKRFFYHTQSLGSVTHVTDEDRQVVESYRYGAYGETTVLDSNSSVVSASQIGNPYMFSARRLDSETGLYYFRARHYSPELKRFVQRDPLEYVDSPSAFAYVSAQPTAIADPSGMTPKFPVVVGQRLQLDSENSSTTTNHTMRILAATVAAGAVTQYTPWVRIGSDSYTDGDWHYTDNYYRRTASLELSALVEETITSGPRDEERYEFDLSNKVGQVDGATQSLAPIQLSGKLTAAAGDLGYASSLGARDMATDGAKYFQKHQMRHGFKQAAATAGRASTAARLFRGIAIFGIAVDISSALTAVSVHNTGNQEVGHHISGYTKTHSRETRTRKMWLVWGEYKSESFAYSDSGGCAIGCPQYGEDDEASVSPTGGL